MDEDIFSLICVVFTALLFPFVYCKGDDTRAVFVNVVDVINITEGSHILHYKNL